MTTTQTTTTTFAASVLDIFGQQPGLSNLYTQLTFIFSLPHTLDPDLQKTQITDVLVNGLESLSASFPWVAGQVINTGADPASSPPNTGVYAIVPLDSMPELVVKDLRDDTSLTMGALRSAHFPFTLLPESLLCPRTSLHLSLSPPSTSPVLVLQATFVQGGMLLTFVAQHNVMDMTSHAFVIKLFDKACNGETFSEEEMKEGNLNREHAIPQLDSGGEEVFTTGLELVPAPSLPTDPTPLPPPNCTWAYFLFSAASLAALKNIAVSTLPASTEFISTDDVSTAFIWQRITRARFPRRSLPADSTNSESTQHNQETSTSTSTRKSTLARAIDPRRFVGLPDTYPGLVQNMTYHTFSPEELVDMPLGIIAAELRAGLTRTVPSDSNSTPQLGIVHATKVFATRLAKTQNKNIVSVTSSLDLVGYDIMLSSWANQRSLYELDFGIAHASSSSSSSSSSPSSSTKLEAIRRPSFTPVESLLYLLPRAPNGEVLLGACLRKEDWEALKTDEGWVKWGRWVG
ncbi:hypothetical protein CVT25_003912 [Psilocybe cyanescens]|uniref:Trichothecene 3-O-acetyltransferase-like N-terminal domain-containing protein n=1 Tax=Psilocybe cyanescens TaxID=93625 RepID=A0A409XKT8_PSICY|nr:hypothetical protein CVT25_003912 [Psilocybe cyanescens]